MIVHVLIPYTTSVACGAKSHQANAAYRDQVTCRLCKETAEYRALSVLPKRFRKIKGRKKR